MQRLWFKAKRFGWGWYPATWEGWLVLLVWLAVLLAFTQWQLGVLPKDLTPLETLSFVGPVLAWAALLTWVCAKTGEKPSWRWGK